MDIDAADADHYFRAEPGSAMRRTTFEVEGAWGRLELESSSGVFSATGLDKGTAVLLESLRRTPCPAPAPGSLLVDVGCGSGVLALVLARLHPGCTIVAVDVNERARALCAENASRNGLGNVSVRSPNECGDLGPVSLLWSNPPVRIGKEALHGLLGEWLPRLAPDGLARLVVSRHLGADSLAAWMGTRGWNVVRIASAKGFRVLDVRPRPQ